MKCKLVNENFRSDYVNNLLSARGVENTEAYIHPTREYLHDPSLFKNIGQAAALYGRIILQERPHILIVVDSDNDGFTSAAIIYQYSLRVNCHARVDYLLHEGKQHGLQDHIDKLMDSNENYDLIILPDSSSNDAHYHDMLDDIHIPCLILDHHITDEALSDNAIVVNNQLSPNYPNKELTGAGVVYQFCRYMDTKLHMNWADDYMDLAAWGIVGDMGGMLDMENRYIVCEGFKHIKNEFFKCLLEKAGYSITGKSSPSWDEIVKNTNPISVAFYVVPMVNALIRVGTMEEKTLLFEAFINGSQMVPCNKRGAKGTMERADVEAARVCTNARSHQNKIIDDTMARVEAKLFKYDLLENKILLLMLDEEKIPSEINGLLAMKLAAKYKKPTMVVREGDDELCKGSMRGLNQSELTDFKSFLESTGYIEWCRGHANAAGVCINYNNLHKFHEYANNALKDIDFGENVYDVNFERSATDNDISLLISELNNAKGLWGQQNDEAMIHITNLNVSKKDVQIMGTNKDTLKIESNGITYIQFKAKSLIEDLQNITGTVKMELVGRPNMNEYMGRRTPQIFIDDYELKANTLVDF